MYVLLLYSVHGVSLGTHFTHNTHSVVGYTTLARKTPSYNAPKRVRPSELRKKEVDTYVF